MCELGHEREQRDRRRAYRRTHAARRVRLRRSRRFHRLRRRRLRRGGAGLEVGVKFLERRGIDLGVTTYNLLPGGVFERGSARLAQVVRIMTYLDRFFA